MAAAAVATDPGRVGEYRSRAGYGSDAGTRSQPGHAGQGGYGGYADAATGTITAAEIRRHFSPFRGASTETGESWRYPAIRPATAGLFRTMSVAPPRGVPGPTPETPAVAGGSRPSTAQPAQPAATPGAAPSGGSSSAPTMAPGVIAPHLAQAFEAFIAGGGGGAGAGAGSAGTAGFPAGVPPVAGGVNGGAGSVVRRSPAALFSRARASVPGISGAVGVPPGAAEVIRRTLPVTNANSNSNSSDSSNAGTTMRQSLTSREWEELVDEVVRRIEYRVADELARRGRRFTPPVY